MSVDNPEQILSKLLKCSLNDGNHPWKDSTCLTKWQALEALNEHYKAQASKDMAEVIGEDETTRNLESPVWNYDGGQNALRAEQRKTAASKGYKVEGE